MGTLERSPVTVALAVQSLGFGGAQGVSGRDEDALQEPAALLAILDLSEAMSLSSCWCRALKSSIETVGEASSRAIDTCFSWSTTVFSIRYRFWTARA